LEEGLPLRRVLVLEYGLVDSRAAEVGAARVVERRVEGMVRAAVGCHGWMGGWVVYRIAVVFAGAVAVDVEGCRNAQLANSRSSSLAANSWCIASPLPSHAAGFVHRFSPS
jgi:hypothetical protein